MINPLSDIRHYSPTMTITQVLKFCEKKEMNITRSMIQNYIRDGLMPPPVNKRQYTHKHLTLLAMIDRLKTVFDMPTIQAALKPYVDDDGLSVETYMELAGGAEALLNKWFAAAGEALKAEPDGGTLLSMSCAAALKSAIV